MLDRNADARQAHVSDLGRTPLVEQRRRRWPKIEHSLLYLGIRDPLTLENRFDGGHNDIINRELPPASIKFFVENGCKLHTVAVMETSSCDSRGQRFVYTSLE